MGSRILAAARHDDAVHPPFQQVTHVVLLADAVIPTVAQEDRHVAGAERVLGALHDGNAEPAEAVGRDQSHGGAAAGEQSPGQGVRLVAEPVRGLADAPDGLQADPAAAVQRLGCRAR